LHVYFNPPRKNRESWTQPCPTGNLFAWAGPKCFHFHEEVEKLVYKWLPLIAIAFVDFKRVVVKDHNVVHSRALHRVRAE
jgi:hypothetical protein